MQIDWISNIVLFSAGLSFATALLAWQRRGRGAPFTFSLMMLAAGVWALFDALESLVPDLPVRIGLSQLSYFGIVSAPVLWFLFALEYDRDGRILSPRYGVWLWLPSLATLVLALTNSRHGLIWKGIHPVPGSTELVYEHGIALWLVLPYFYLLILGGVLLFIRAIRHRAERLYRSQQVLLLSGALLPWVGNIVYMSGRNPLPGVDLTPALFSVSGLCYLWGMLGWRLFDLMPVAQEVVLAHVPDGVLVFDDRLRLVGINPAGRRLLGLADDVAPEGRPAAELLRACTGLAGVLADGTPPGGEPLIAPDGLTRLEPVIVPLCSRSGRSIGRALILHDTTDRVRAEADRRRRQHGDAELHKVESLTRMAAGVAHLFNNQMQVVLGNVDMTAVSPRLSDTDRTALRDARRAAERASELSRLMTLYVGQDARRVARLELRELVRTHEAALRAALPADAALALELPAARLPVEGNADALRQLLLNLVTNAGEALPGGRGRVTVRVRALACDRAWFESAHPHDPMPDGVYAALEVEDDGAGMPAEVRARLFEPFFSTRFLGRGLGLAAVLGIVRYHRGAVRVKSEPGRGTLFQVVLPGTASDGP